MHVHVVDVGAGAVDHDVVAGGRVVLLELDRPAAGRHQRRAALGEHVLALVAVTGAAGAEAGAGAAEVVPAADREDVVVEVEGVALDVCRPARLRTSAPSALVAALSRNE